MNQSIVFNRMTALPPEPPEWVQLVPWGDFPGQYSTGAKVVQQYDDEWCAEELVREFNAGSNEVLVDFEHWSSRLDGDTTAAGWIDRLEAREDGLYGRISWSTRGADAVRNREYRYLSPVFRLMEIEENAEGIPVGVPVAFDGAGLTNKPNIREIKPIANKKPAGESPAEPNGGEVMQEVAKLLGLDEGADEAAIVEAVKAVQNKARDAEEKARQIENKALEAEADQFVAANSDAIADADKVKAQYVENRESTIALFGSLKKQAERKEVRTVHNRENTKQPDDQFDAPSADGGAAQRNAVEKYRIENKCSFDQAWNMVRMERPELFADNNE